MSGTIVNNITRTSGTIAPTTGGLSWSSDVVTGSTATVSAGNGYWINTTSNACTVTLPSSAEIGDQIILADYARTWSTNNLIIDSNGNNFQGETDDFIVDYSPAGQSISIVFSDSTKGWIPVSDDAVVDAPVTPTLQKGIFGFGNGSGYANTGVTNIVSSAGVVASDVSAVGTARNSLAAASYGGDKAIFAYGHTSTSGNQTSSLKNLVSNSGVVASDVTGVGTARRYLAAASYGGDKAIFAYGSTAGNGVSYVSLKNLVSNSGVVAADVSGVGTARGLLAAASYGVGLAIFAYGYTGSRVSMKNLVNSSGVVAADVSGVGTARYRLAAASYGVGLAIFGYGDSSGVAGTAITNKVNSSGVVASDTSGVGTTRGELAATVFGGDRAIFGYGNAGNSPTFASMTNIVSNQGVVASDVTGVGSGRNQLAATGFSLG